MSPRLLLVTLALGVVELRKGVAPVTAHHPPGRSSCAAIGRLMARAGGGSVVVLALQRASQTLSVMASPRWCLSLQRPFGSYLRSMQRLAASRDQVITPPTLCRYRFALLGAGTPVSRELRPGRHHNSTAAKAALAIDAGE